MESRIYRVVGPLDVGGVAEGGLVTFDLDPSTMTTADGVRVDLILAAGLIVDHPATSNEVGPAARRGKP